MTDASRVRVSSTRILFIIPLTLSILTNVYHLTRFHKIIPEHSSVSCSLQKFPVPRQPIDTSNDEALILHKSCVITVAAWGYYAHVRTLYDSVKLNSPNISCFIWFVADTIHHSEDDGPKISLIKERAAGLFDIVTVDQITHKTNKSSLFTMLSFQSKISEDQCAAFITPLALQYTMETYEADSVIYLDKYLWVNSTLQVIQSKLFTQSIVMGPTPSDSQESSVFIALKRNAPAAIKYIALWNDHISIYGLHPFHVVSVNDEEEWNVLYDKPSQMTIWNFHSPQQHGTIPSSKYAKQALVIRFNYSETYNKHLEDHNTSYFQQIIYGFNYFSDGTLIEPWMGELFQSMMTPVTENHDSTILHTLDPENIYTRLYFQDGVFVDPFWTEIPTQQDSGNQMTFMDWMLRGPSSYAVDMEGIFYFSEIEDQTYKSLSYYPLDVHDPSGDDYHLYKIWFQAMEMESISENLQKMVLSRYNYHRSNHNLFHRSADEEIGVNIIGWHGGLFGIGKTSVKMYQAAVFGGIQANAIELMPIRSESFIHPRWLPYKLSRSCSQQVNLVMMNADWTLYTKKEIPDLIWNYKYNIGFWEWEVDVFPEALMENLQYYDEIWAPSHFIVSSIVNSKGYDGTPVKVLPLPLTTEVKAHADSENTKKSVSLIGSLQPLFEDLSDSFVFLVVFDFHSLMLRKNPYASIIAFLDAFPSNMTVGYGSYHLIVKSHHGTSSELDEMKEIARNDPRVHFLSDTLSDEDHDALQNRADCYVSLHRCEGYGMNILEEMGNGIPVIATNYSGNVDFFPPLHQFWGRCIFPIPYSLVTVTEKIGPYQAGFRWADPDHEKTVLAMREVVKNNCKRDSGKEISRLTFSSFGMEAISEKMKVLLEASSEKIHAKQKKVLDAFNENELSVYEKYGMVNTASFE